MAKWTKYEYLVKALVYVSVHFTRSSDLHNVYCLKVEMPLVISEGQALTALEGILKNSMKIQTRNGFQCSPSPLSQDLSLPS